MRICLPVLMGLEAVVGREAEALGVPSAEIEKRDGVVYVDVPADAKARSDRIARLNVGLASAERVMLEVGRGDVRNFDDLFRLTLSIPWERFIPDDHPFAVSGYSRQSKLTSIPACQRTIKKAQVVRLQEARGLPEDTEVRENPSLPPVKMQFALMKDEISFRIDTTGPSLHKRGYRSESVEAPIRETLAAGMLELSRWEAFSDEGVWDPCCGSGTFIIEAARQAAGMAPGCRRRFSGEWWPYLDASSFDEARRAAWRAMDPEPPERPFLLGTDIDEDAIEVARKNAERAGVAAFCRFDVLDVAEARTEDILGWLGTDRVMIISNPPYGERLGSVEEARRVNHLLASRAISGGELRDRTRLFVITDDDTFERTAGRRADKRRKLYNGMIPCTYYQYFRHGRR